jgi:8-oxo-dGTP pyrophosphatase MutT (NUDIX family)
VALEPWPARGPARIVFEHDHYPTILEEDRELPNGRTISWLRYADHRDGVELVDGVMGICVRGEEVLLARQFNPGADAVVWELPGGGVHTGESFEDAVRRELMEEVGWYPHELRYLGRVLFNNRRSGWGLRTYLATELEARSLPADEGEHIETEWFPLTAIAGMIRAGELDNGTLLSGWALLQASGRLQL